jgi:O-antigen/teichoic acid export membrane protein
VTQTIPLQSATVESSTEVGGSLVSGRTLASNALIGYAGSISLTALGLATKVVLIRSLAPADFGRVVTTQNLLAFVLVISSLSITEAVVRFVGLYSRHDLSRAKGVVLKASWFTILSGTTATVVLLEFAQPVAAWFGLGTQGERGVILSAVAIIPSLCADVIGGGLRGVNRLWVKVVALDLSRALAMFTGYVGLAFIGWATYIGAISVQLVAILLSTGLVIVAFRREPSFLRPANPAGLAELLEYSVPLCASGLIGGTLVGSGIPLILAAQGAPEMVGVYAIALTVQPLLQLPATAIENAALPLWAAESGSQRERHLAESFAHVTRWALILALLVYIPLAIAPRESLQLLFGNRQLGSMVVVEIVLTTTLFAVAVGPTEGMLRALGSTRALVIARLAAGIAFTAAWPLIWTWGVTGAIVAWALNGVIANAVSVFFLIRLHGIQPIDSRYLRTLVVGIIAWLACASVSATNVQGLTKLVAIVSTNTLTFAILGSLLGAWHSAELTSLFQQPRNR